MNPVTRVFVLKPASCCPPSSFAILAPLGTPKCAGYSISFVHNSDECADMAISVQLTVLKRRLQVFYTMCRQSLWKQRLLQPGRNYIYWAKLWRRANLWVLWEGYNCYYCCFKLHWLTPVFHLLKYFYNRSTHSLLLSYKAFKMRWWAWI